MKQNTRHFVVAGLLVVVGSFIVYAILNAVYQLPAASSAEAVPIDQLFRGHFIMISFLFSLIVVFMLYSVVVFRRRPGDDSDGVHFHGNTALEIAWTVIPLVLVVVFGIWGQQTLNAVTAESADEMVVRVTGFQWYWEFEYPEYDDLRTNNQMVLPVDRTIRLELRSEGLGPDDPGVNHAFWIPEFRVKRDLIPGQVYDLRITPTEIGEFKLRCAELCGTGHSLMLADVSVRSASEFDQWATEQASLQSGVADMTPEERGRVWYANNGCVGCHSLDGTPGVGPTWQGLLGREEQLTDGSTVIADEDYIHRSIVGPNTQIVSGYSANVMPNTYGEQLTEAQIQDIIAFIKTLTE